MYFTRVNARQDRHVGRWEPLSSRTWSPTAVSMKRLKFQITEMARNPLTAAMRRHRGRRRSELIRYLSPNGFPSLHQIWAEKQFRSGSHFSIEVRHICFFGVEMISSYRTCLTDLASKIASIQGTAEFHWAVISANGGRQRWKLRCLSHESDQLALPMKHREQQHPFGAPEAALLPQRHPGRHLMTEKILKLQLRFR